MSNAHTLQIIFGEIYKKITFTNSNYSAADIILYILKYIYMFAV